MALISMAVYDTAENQRSTLTEITLQSLAKTVDWNRHRLVVVDNGSVEDTHTVYDRMKSVLPFEVLTLGSNVGTAKAVNRGWLLRRPDEHAVKMDNDVRIRDCDWLDRLEDCVERDHTLGIIGLKRPDLIEAPWTDGWYHSELKMLPHEPGQSWLTVEVVNHVMGTVQLYSHRLLEKIGFLYQMGGLYGFDDALASARCHYVGMYSAFYCNVHIDHVDHGTTPYQKWKEAYASTRFDTYYKVLAEYKAGTRSVYNGPEDE